MELLTIIAAVWGATWTLNSAVSAFLQTKWMYDQRRYLREIRDHLTAMRGDDLRKMDVGGCQGDPSWIDEPSVATPFTLDMSHACNLPNCILCKCEECGQVFGKCKCFSEPTVTPQITENTVCENCGHKVADCECFTDGPYDNLDPID